MEDRKTIEVKAGGASFDAAAAMSLTREQFTERYMRLGFGNWIEDLAKRRKYLSGCWDECKRKMEKVGYKAVEVNAPAVDDPPASVVVDPPAVRNPRIRKATEKKE